MRLFIVGLQESGQMGSYLAAAAQQVGLNGIILDAGQAEARGRIGQSFYWRLRGKRPGRLRAFSRDVVRECAQGRPDLVIATGRAPLDIACLEALHDLGAKVVNYSTDDPWNPALRAPWFLKVLPHYDAIFTTRRANIEDFRQAGVRTVQYLPFAYDPESHRPGVPETSSRPCDVLFVGGCDADRLPLIAALIDAGLDVALFGGYWNRHTLTRPYWRGMADQETIRTASASARVCLCLVRRANRDENVMRSFEAAAIGGCILAEDTRDHRELYGDAARYFTTNDDLVREARDLVCRDDVRADLARHLRQRVARTSNTYADRLREILRSTGFGAPAVSSIASDRRLVQNAL
jgi:hypothetical protein